MPTKYEGIPQLAYPFVPGATSAQDNARLSLEYSDKHQNRLNNSLKGGSEDITIYNGGPFVKQARGPYNGKSISIQGNTNMVNGQANAEYDHYAFKKGGNKRRKSRKRKSRKRKSRKRKSRKRKSKKYKKN